MHQNLSSVQSPVLSVPEATVERNDSLLTGRNLWQNQTQEGWPSASTSWGLRRQKKGEKHHNTIRRISVGTGKHELITTIMSHVHNIIEKSNSHSYRSLVFMFNFLVVCLVSSLAWLPVLSLHFLLSVVRCVRCLVTSLPPLEIMVHVTNVVFL